MEIETVLTVGFGLAALACFCAYKFGRSSVLASVAEACRRVTEIQGRSLAGNPEASAGAEWALAELYALVDKQVPWLLSSRARLSIRAGDLR